MVSTEPAARRATMGDVPTLTRTLARAYHDDPVAVWACRSNALRSAMLEGLYRARLQQMLVHHEIWVTAELSSTAVWVPPPGDRKASLMQEAAVLRCFLHPRLIRRVPLLAVGNIVMKRRHPRTRPHWYLSLLGTDPDARGNGLGSAVLRPVLERSDAEAVGIYLESSKERNIAFYARLGFRLTAEFRLPRGPRMWAMWREPAAGR
jgi:ribosomal protein S18 acetylase RimI-like enzyme